LILGFFCFNHKNVASCLVFTNVTQYSLLAVISVIIGAWRSVQPRNLLPTAGHASAGFPDVISPTMRPWSSASLSCVYAADVFFAYCSAAGGSFDVHATASPLLQLLGAEVNAFYLKAALYIPADHMYAFFLQPD
jgi:hypothetical protein